MIHICLAVDPVTMRPRVVKGIVAIGGAAFGPSIIDGRRCDPATLAFVRQWLGSGFLPPNCR